MKISLDWSQSCKSSTWKERPRCSLATWRVCEGFFFEQKNRRQSNETIRFWMTQERRWRTGRSAPSRTKPWRGRTRRIPSTRASRWPSWRTRAGTRPTWNWPSRSAGAVTWAATSPNAAAWTGWKPGPPGAVPFFFVQPPLSVFFLLPLCVHEINERCPGNQQWLLRKDLYWFSERERRRKIRVGFIKIKKMTSLGPSTEGFFLSATQSLWKKRVIIDVNSVVSSVARDDLLVFDADEKWLTLMKKRRWWEIVRKRWRYNEIALGCCDRFKRSQHVST